jgi:Domain of unknown function (DUF4440)
VSDTLGQLEELAQEWASAKLRGDTALLGSAMTEDFVGVGPLGFMLTKDQWLGRFAGGLSYESFALEEVEVRLHGETAVLTGRQKQAGGFQGNDVGRVPREPGARGGRRLLAVGRLARQPHRGVAVVPEPLIALGDLRNKKAHVG